MGPRYKYENGRFVVFRHREADEWTQFSSSDDRMKDAYFNLTIQFPATPDSENGTIKGNTVTWNFDAESLERYNAMDIGQNIIHASIPAGAIKTTIIPRLVTESGLDKEKEYRPLHKFSAYIPVVGKKYANSGYGDLTVFYDTKKIETPFSYKDLKIKNMIIDGNP